MNETAQHVRDEFPTRPANDVPMIGAKRITSAFHSLGPFGKRSLPSNASEFRGRGGFDFLQLAAVRRCAAGLVGLAAAFAAGEGGEVAEEVAGF